MKEYYVSYMCIFNMIVEADSPEEAADLAEQECEYDIDGPAYVVDAESGEEWTL